MEKEKRHAPKNLEEIHQVMKKYGLRDIQAFTCYHCPENLVCEHAWDIYNLYGECLLEK